MRKNAEEKTLHWEMHFSEAAQSFNLNFQVCRTALHMIIYPEGPEPISNSHLFISFFACLSLNVGNLGIRFLRYR